MNKYLFKIQSHINNIKKNNFNIKNSFVPIIAIIIIIFLILLYFTIPAYYNYENFDKEIKKKISSDFKIELEGIKGIKYSILPRPHFIIEECSVYFSNNTKEEIAKIKNLKINIYSKNLYRKEKIEIKNIYFNNIDFDLQFIDLKNFYYHLKNSITKPIYINNSNIFFRDEINKIVLISKIKSFKYNVNLKNKDKKLNILGKLFGSDFSFNYKKNYLNPPVTKSSLRFKNPNIKIENIFKKDNKNFIVAKSNFNFLRNSFIFNYKFDKNNIKFFHPENEKNLFYQSRLLGSINLEPFFFDLNLNLSGISLETLQKYVFLNMYKFNKSSHVNFNGNLKINLEEFNNRLFEKYNLTINFLDQKISLNESNLFLKKIGKINFSDPLFYEKNQKLFVKSKIKFDIIDQEQLYKRFQVPRASRINLNKVYFEIEYNVDDDVYFLSNINFNEDLKKEDSIFYEIKNIQQLNKLVTSEFKKINLD